MELVHTWMAWAIIGLPWLGAAVPADRPAVHDWPQLRGNAGFTGVSPDESVRPPLRLLWSYRCDSDTSGDAGSGVTVGGGRVFANMAMTRSVLALDAHTGKFAWEFSHPDMHYQQSTSYADGRAYVWLRAWGRSTLVALDAESGRELWARKFKSSKDIDARRAGAAAFDGKLFLPDSDDGPVILAVDPATGNEVWRRPLGADDGELVVAPCAAGGLVFAGTCVRFEKDREVRGQVVALDARDGRVVWTNRAVYPSAHMVSDGEILVCKINREVGMKPADNQKLYVLDARTGNELWSVPIRSLYSTETITRDLVIEKHYGGQMVARDRATGKVRWSASINTGSGCSSPSLSGNFAYVGTGSFNDSEGFWAWRFIEPPHTQKGEQGLCWTLHAIDLNTGRSVWQYLTGCNVCGDPAIAYGRLYFNSRDGRIYCLAPVAADDPTTMPDSPDKTPNAPPEQVRKLLAEELAAVPAPASRGDWPMLGFSPDRAGNRDATLTVPLEPAWKLDTGGRVLGGPAIRDGRVFVGSLSGKVLAADLASGQKAWEFQTGGEVRCTPAAADGLVYCGSDDGKLRALDAASGRESWAYSAGGPVQASPAVVGGVVFFGANDHHVYALDRRTGRKLWSFRTGYPLVQAPPVVHGGQVFVGQWVDWACALDAATGKEQWRTCVPISIEALHFYRDRLWLRSAYQFAEFDPTTGKRLRIGDAVYGYNGLAFTGKWMVTTGTGSAAAVNLDDPGEEQKTKTANLEEVKVLRGKGLLGWPRLASMGTPLAVGDKLCFASRKGELLVTDMAGKVLWASPLGGTCHGSPAICGGMLVVGCDDGFLYAFGPKPKAGD